jgi:predicted dinucleotide-binding enzyme
MSLANGFNDIGCTVMLGSRDPTTLAGRLASTGTTTVSVGPFTDAASFGDAVVLAVKGTAAVDVVSLVGDETLRGKTVIDTTNPIADSGPEGGVLKLFTGLDLSLMERLQNAAPNARFVKAFNSVGHALMVNPDFDGVRPTMFICGDNEHADMGGAEAARAIEPLCMLWCIPGLLRNEWTHAFKLLEK